MLVLNISFYLGISSSDTESFEESSRALSLSTASCMSREDFSIFTLNINSNKHYKFDIANTN